MKKFRRVFLVVLVLALAGIVSSVKWSEPRYHLRPISSWLAKYGDGPGNYRPSSEADHALQQMGSNAVPYLLKLLHSTNSYSFHTFLRKPNMRFLPGGSGSWNRLSAWWMNTRYRFQWVTVPASWDHWKAYLAFQALGPEGTSAIPELVKLADDPSTNSSPSNTGEAPPIAFWKDTKNISVFAAQSSTYRPHGSPVIPIRFFGFFSGFVPQPFLSDGEIAAWSLAAIGADSVPPLMAMLTNSNPQIRSRAAMALGMMGKAAEPAVPALVKVLDDRGSSNSAEWHSDPYAYSPSPGSVPYDPAINARREAADALGWIGQEPDLVVPVLIKTFGDLNVESAAIGSLGAFGERATNAIPALLTFFRTEYNSPNQTRGQYRIGDVALALNKISSDTTRKEVITLLIYRIRNPKSPWNQSMTLNTLGQMTNQPDLVIPVLLEALDTTAGYNRISTVNQLGGFGPAATSAIPKLISFSTSQDTNLCRIVTNTLDKIEPGWRTGH